MPRVYYKYEDRANARELWKLQKRKRGIIMNSFNLVYRTLSWADLRALCIQNEWCTCMTNEEYMALLAYTENHITDPVLYTIANLIYEGTHKYDTEAYSDVERKDSMAYIMSLINRKCVYHM